MNTPTNIHFFFFYSTRTISLIETLRRSNSCQIRTLRIRWTSTRSCLRWLPCARSPFKTAPGTRHSARCRATRNSTVALELVHVHRVNADLPVRFGDVHRTPPRTLTVRRACRCTLNSDCHGQS